MASLLVSIANGWTDGRTDGRRTEHSRAPYYKLPPRTEEEAKKRKQSKEYTKTTQ